MWSKIVLQIILLRPLSLTSILTLYGVHHVRKLIPSFTLTQLIVLTLVVIIRISETWIHHTRPV
jgi:hypothetical protein